MRKLKSLLLLLAAGTVFYACNDQDVKPEEPNFVSVVIPDAYKAPDNARSSSDDVDDVIVDVQITLDNGDKVTGKARLVMHDDETLSYFALTENLMEAANLSPDFWVNDSARNGARVMGCFEDCQQYRGDEGEKTALFTACKVDCWIGIAVTIITIVAL